MNVVTIKVKKEIKLLLSLPWSQYMDMSSELHNPGRFQQSPAAINNEAG